MERRDGIINIDYSQFYVTERVESGFERLDESPDFTSGRPVLLASDR
ncbi:hypothetical protein [Streptomyces sp. WAC 06738]|nr:hypothetical protein [Streptomyces sp. WAC 06738]